MAAKKKARATADVAPSSPEELRVTSYQHFEAKRMHRRDIKGAPYNPRTIDREARRRLKDQLKKRGLLNALVVNAKTGMLVSGHQRLSILDDLEGTYDYALDVNVVTLTPKQEREVNAFFNNPNAQGTYDLTKLADLLSTDGLNIEDAGFSAMDLALTFEGTEFETIFSPSAQAAEVSESMQSLAEMAPNGRDAKGEAIRDPKAFERVVGGRDALRKKMRDANGERDTEWYVVVVCSDRAARERLMVALGKDADDKYIDANDLALRLGIDVD